MQRWQLMVRHPSISDSPFALQCFISISILNEWQKIFTYPSLHPPFSSLPSLPREEGRECLLQNTDQDYRCQPDTCSRDHLEHLIKTKFSDIFARIPPAPTLALSVQHGDALHLLGPDAGHDVWLLSPVLEAALHHGVVLLDVDIAVAVLPRHLVTAHHGPLGVTWGALWVVGAWQALAWDHKLVKPEPSSYVLPSMKTPILSWRARKMILRSALYPLFCWQVVVLKCLKNKMTNTLNIKLPSTNRVNRYH